MIQTSLGDSQTYAVFRLPLSLFGSTLLIMNRILLEKDEIDTDGRAALGGRRAEHIAKVLGSRAGDSVRIGVIDGPRGDGRIESLGSGQAQLRCTLDMSPMPPTGVSLLLAIPRPKVMHRLWAPLASLGVDKIVLTNAAKVERNYFDTHWLELSAFRPLLIEGLEQSGDTRLPSVHICRRFKPFIEDESQQIFGTATRIVCHPGRTQSLGSVLPSGRAEIVIAIGPEGGWTEFELELLCGHGFACASFGNRTLRTDTAVYAILEPSWHFAAKVSDLRAFHAGHKAGCRRAGSTPLQLRNQSGNEPQTASSYRRRKH